MITAKSGEKVFPLGFFQDCPVIEIPYDNEGSLTGGELRTLEEMGITPLYFPRLSALERVLRDLGIDVTHEILQTVKDAVEGKYPEPKIVQLEGEISHIAGMSVN